MKTLSYYKSQYKRRKTQKGKQAVFNTAMLNLNWYDQQTFCFWQIKEMNKN